MIGPDSYMKNFSVRNVQLPVLQRLFNSPFFLVLCGLMIFLVMAGMAWILYQERMLNYDPVFFSFLLIQEEWFSPVLGRSDYGFGE